MRLEKHRPIHSHTLLLKSWPFKWPLNFTETVICMCSLAILLVLNLHSFGLRALKEIETLNCINLAAGHQGWAATLLGRSKLLY